MALINTILTLLSCSHFVALGAVAVIISVLSDPFIQNLIHYDNRNIRDVSQASKLARSLEYTTRGPRYLFGRKYSFLPAYSYRAS